VGFDSSIGDALTARADGVSSLYRPSCMVGFEKTWIMICPLSLIIHQLPDSARQIGVSPLLFAHTSIQQACQWISYEYCSAHRIAPRLPFALNSTLPIYFILFFACTTHVAVLVVLLGTSFSLKVTIAENSRPSTREELSP
jgi:hypothetical protein